jgi:hypothetical protein
LCDWRSAVAGDLRSTTYTSAILQILFWHAAGSNNSHFDLPVLYLRLQPLVPPGISQRVPEKSISWVCCTLCPWQPKPSNNSAASPFDHTKTEWSHNLQMAVDCANRYREHRESSREIELESEAGATGDAHSDLSVEQCKVRGLFPPSQ